MTVIGITGRAGSGKSTAAKIIQKELKAELIDLDQVGHELLATDLVRELLYERFGEDIMDKTSNVSRSKLGKIVFADPEKLTALNEIMHPLMDRSVRDQVRKNADKPILIVGALILEIGLRDICDHSIIVDAEDVLIEKHAGKAKLKIALVQRSREAYFEEGDYVILNSFEESELKERCLDILSSMSDIPES